MNFRDFFDFEKFLTPSLVKIVYWAGLLGIVLVSLSSVLAAHGGNPLLRLAGGVLLILGGSIFWRVLCEGIILTFKMYDRMTEIRDRLPRN